MNREIENMINMIRCNRGEFLDMISVSEGKVFMSSGSRYTPYSIYDGLGLLMKYDANGKLIYSRKLEDTT